MTDAEEVLAESRKAIEILTRLAARLEVFTDRIETELARRVREENEDGRGQPD
jgi:hypothetical protein